VNQSSARPAMSLEGVESLIQLSYMVLATIERAGAPHGLTPNQMRLVAILRDRKLTMTGLGTFLELEKSSVTTLVDRAEERGFVRRVRSESDRRSMIVQLTDRGRRLDDRLRRAITASVANLFGVLTAPQAARASTILVRVAASVTPGHP
jgi:DNA-binding MarR family transcriptional regulator